MSNATSCPILSSTLIQQQQQMCQRDVQVRGSRLYAEHVAPYTDPLVQRLARSPYYKAAFEHIKPADMAAAPAQGVAHDQTVNTPAVPAITTAPASQR